MTWRLGQIQITSYDPRKLVIIERKCKLGHMLFLEELQIGRQISRANLVDCEVAKREGRVCTYISRSKKV